MTTEQMIEELYKVAEKHSRDVVGVGELNIHAMCIDVVERLTELLKQLESRVSRMIPCWMEMPPYSDELILIQCSGKPARNITFEDGYALASYTEEGWIVEGWPEWVDPEVISWYPLPEGYYTEMEEHSKPSWKESVLRTFLGGDT